MSILSSAATQVGVNDTRTQAQVAQDKLDDDLNQFLTLLVTQLQNQDPLEPLDANEFTSQLVQFASVEQQIYQNSNLEKLVEMQQTSQVGSMVSYLGTIIEANGDAFNLEDGVAKFSFNLEDKASEATLTIQDAIGKTIYTTGINTDAGKEVFVWDGLKSDGTQAPDGPYTAVVSAKDREGDLINVAQTVFGRVTGAGAQDGKVTLSMGAIDAPLEDVLNVTEAPSVVAAP
ncbi:MAG: flagellar hook capping protein [Rhodospirillaceae bacterium]|nr:MAG: flagellar hook capping protein [Rhodospirillaceae bacterium]